MAFESKIQWTEATWNPWHGCRKVSPGCKYCYMYRDKDRYGQDPTTVLRSKTKFNAPLRWTEPKLIFTCSWSDWFIEEADEWREEAWRIIKQTPQHTYQILTKRPERIADCLPSDWGEGYENVWIGVSVENQEMYHERIWHLCHIPAKVRFLSIEPLIGPVVITFNSFISDEKGVPKWSGPKVKDLIHWVIVGGESGNETGKYKYRPCEVEWIESIIRQCYEFDVPVFIKQMGTYLAKKGNLSDRHGGDPNEWVGQLEVREMPKSYRQPIVT